MSNDKKVVPEQIYVQDGALTSAGVNAGIDHALKLIEDDHGRDLVLTVARRLAVLLKHLAANLSSARIWRRRWPTRERFAPCSIGSSIISRSV
jgi:transcriptional regulator GlxA family with amidase domain